MDPDSPIHGAPPPPTANPPLFNYVLGFLLVGACWGLTTPFMRRAALAYAAEGDAAKARASSASASASSPNLRSSQDDERERERDDVDEPLMTTATTTTTTSRSHQRQQQQQQQSWLRAKVAGIVSAVVDLLKKPAYLVPLLLNVTGSVWFFLHICKAELSLTVPITNSLAFLFTVLGEWWAEGKVITRDTWIGMSFVLAGIALCVHAKQ